MAFGFAVLLAHIHGAEAKRADLDAGAPQFTVFHHPSFRAARRSDAIIMKFSCPECV
jgi:hypothetical protein